MPATTPTQSEILKYLKENPGDFVSGADLAERFGISRTGIWKHVQKLKTMGYDILSHPKDGYKLIEVPDSLAVDEIVPNLATRWMGRSYHYLETIGSTNDHALLLAAQGAPHGTVVVAEQQTRGRGRMRREWLSAPNRGIYMSILLRDPLPVRVAPQSTYVAGLALAKVLREHFALASSMKWPNDIMISGKKVAGILTEMQSDQDYSRFIVVGIGINVNYGREEMAGPFRYPATSILLETGRTVKRQALLQAFLRRFETDYEIFVGDGFTRMIPELEEFSGILGRNITVVCGDREISGKAQGFTPEGALSLLRSDGKLEDIWAGDVTRVEGAA
ncbi:MAG: biotin--[acetyl-CoA-carboxylase] ligase [Syntrophobacteraceae bacterium]